MRLFLFVFLSIFCICPVLQAQQRSLISNYFQNGIIINPAYTGSAGALSLSLASRLQWQGVENAPVTNIIAAHTPLPIRFISTGLIVGYDKFGPTNTTDIANSYAIRFNIKKYTVSLGGLIGFTSINNAIDNSDPRVQSDVAFNQNQIFTLKTGFGIHVEHKKFYLGFSVPSYGLSKKNGADSSPFYNQQYFYGGYNWAIGENFILKPSIYIRSLKGSGALPDFNLMATVMNKFTGGISYRPSNALVGLLNMKVSNQLYIGYSYDYLLSGNSSLSSVSNGSHEIFIRYDFLYLINDINMKKFK